MAVLRWCYRSLFVSDYWPVYERLLGLGANDYSLRMQATIGSYIKLLLVWGRMTRAVSLCPLSLPSTLSGKMLYIPSRYQGRSEGLITVSLAPCICFLLRMKLFPTYWDEEAHLSLLFPMYRKLGASYHYYKRPITPLLYSWLTVVKSVCALGPFLNQYWSLSWPVLLRSSTSTGNIYRPVLVSSVTSTGCLPLLNRKDYLASRDCATLSVPLQEECPTQAP